MVSIPLGVLPVLGGLTLRLQKPHCRWLQRPERVIASAIASASAVPNKLLPQLPLSQLLR